MRKNLVELQRERGRLIERIAHQRAALARQTAPLKTACDTADYALATARSVLHHTAGFVRRHPATAAGLAAALLTFRPRRTVRWLGRALFAWRSWRSLRGWLAR